MSRSKLVVGSCIGVEDRLFLHESVRPFHQVKRARLFYARAAISSALLSRYRFRQDSIGAERGLLFGLQDCVERGKFPTELSSPRRVDVNPISKMLVIDPIKRVNVDAPMRCDLLSQKNAIGSADRSVENESAMQARHGRLDDEDLRTRF